MPNRRLDKKTLAFVEKRVCAFLIKHQNSLAEEELTATKLAQRFGISGPTISLLAKKCDVKLPTVVIFQRKTSNKGKLVCMYKCQQLHVNNTDSPEKFFCMRFLVYLEKTHAGKPQRCSQCLNYRKDT